MLLCIVNSRAPIGIFDSGYGGLTVFRSIKEKLPQYDFLYLGDNARSPYGNRSFDTVHEYTFECVQWFFNMGCPLVILACNTASAKALRTIQQHDLPKINPNNRVLGVIRPTAEIIGSFSKAKKVGVLGTKGTIVSESYPIEIHHFFPDVKVYQQPCPMFVPLIENGEYDSEAADFFVKKYLDELLAQDKDIDTILLACTHYPLLMNKMKQHLLENVKIVPQGEIVADSLTDYLHRHPEMDLKLTKNQTTHFFTTDDANDFEAHATIFFGEKVVANRIELTHIK